MYGFVRPLVPELKIKEHAFYKSVYCGLCRSMKKHTGVISPVTLSYDMVFFALVRIALGGVLPEIRPRRCLRHPLKKRPMADDMPALEYSARVSAILFSAKAQDGVTDEKGLKKFVWQMISPCAKGIGKKAGLDAVAAEVAGSMLVLSRLEKEKCAAPDMPADVFGKMLAQLGSLGLDGEKADIAREIFLHTGRFVYLADAAKDYEDDVRRGRYNPFALALDSASEAEKFFSEGLSDMLAYELHPALTAAALIERDGVGIAVSCIENIIGGGMMSELDNIITEKRRSK